MVTGGALEDLQPLPRLTVAGLAICVRLTDAGLETVQPDRLPSISYGAPESGWELGATALGRLRHYEHLSLPHSDR